MSTTALDIHWTAASTGKKASTKISYVNPEADSEELKSLAQRLNSLTTNTYQEATRIDQINVDTEEEIKNRNMHFGTLTQGALADIFYEIENQNSSANPALFFYNTSTNTASLVTTSEQIIIDDTHAKRTFTVPSSAGYLFAGLSKSTHYYSEFISGQIL